MENRAWQWSVGVIYIVAVAVIWITASFVVQSVVEGGVSPYLITYMCNSLFVVYVPMVESANWFKHSSQAAALAHFLHGLWSRDKEAGSAEQDKGHLLGQEEAAEVAEAGGIKLGQLEVEPGTEDGGSGLSRKDTAIVSLIICPVWFLAQLTNNLSLKFTSVTSNTILSSTASLFTFLVSLKYLSEKYTCVKLLSVLACMAGTVVVSLADSKKDSDAEAPNPVLGDLFCLGSAFLYAIYTTLMRKFLLPKFNTALFLGYLGLFNGLLFLPFLLILHFTGLEPVHRLTVTQLCLILGKGLLDNVISDYLWAKAVLLTSPTAATAGLTIQVPIAVAVDTLKGRLPSVLNLLGGVTVLLGFMGINQPCCTEAINDEDLEVVDKSGEGEAIVN